MLGILLGLLGVGLLSAFTFGDDDDDQVAQRGEDGEEPPEQTEHPPECEGPPQGIELFFDGAETLTGTEGDDTLGAGQDSLLSPELIRLLGGDDLATLEFSSLTSVEGGHGNDTLLSSGTENTLSGGAGDDTLSGSDGVSMFGGSGNDEILYEVEIGNIDARVELDGGTGEDTITVDAIAGQDFPDPATIDVTGGPGADSFEIVYDLNDSDQELAEADGVIASGSINIGDFDPEEDTLLIEVERDDTNSDRATTIELLQTENDDGTFATEVTLTFEATETALEAVSILNITSTAAFGLSDINLASV